MHIVKDASYDDGMKIASNYEALENKIKDLEKELAIYKNTSMKIRLALDNVLDHCSADIEDIDLIEDFVLAELNVKTQKGTK